MIIDLQCLQLQSWANPLPEHLQWQQTLRQFLQGLRSQLHTSLHIPWVDCRWEIFEAIESIAGNSQTACLPINLDLIVSTLAFREGRRNEYAIGQSCGHNHGRFVGAVRGKDFLHVTSE